ncbi:hypothetical protein B0H67DRAFT_362884 [Lasiosphaeris hirsuta]|uniref:Rhodopsin domain-containing protein n=1 Tax=Lasiosphaeris hirsuta TaxID=260670 RepID=A0AA39ZWK2_9PEZI|nr:hypothetical protein B0H67DRAFT_362884 [Lasiosphaeris hirsuta]
MDASFSPTSPLQQFAIAVNFFFPALALVVLGLRIYSKTSFKSFGADDAFICLAMMFSIGLTVASYFCALACREALLHITDSRSVIKTNYIGIDFDDIPPHSSEPPRIWALAIQALYFPILVFVKLSVLCFLLRLGGHKPGVRYVIYGLNIFQSGLGISVFVASLLQCRPFEFYWDQSVPGGTCINQPLLYLTQSGLNFVTDVFTLALPIWIFLGLKMPRRLKVATLYVFLLGGVVTLIAVARFVFLYMLFFSPHGLSENYTMSFCLSAVETNLGIICACAPTLRGLLRAWFPRVLVTGAGRQYATGIPYSEVAAAGNRNSYRYSSRYHSNNRYSARFSFCNEGQFCVKGGPGNHVQAEGAMGRSLSQEEIMSHPAVLRSPDGTAERVSERPSSATRLDALGRSADGERPASRGGGAL